jgi:hypothetical protein
VDRENALHTNSIGNFSHRKGCAVTATRHADDDPFENLGSLFLAFDDFDVNANRFPGPKRGRFLFALLGFQLTDDVHDGAPVYR